jgi:protoheme IX farnesyltransferase
MAGKVYMIGAALLSGIFVLAAARVLYDETHTSARRMFGYSIFYLFALFGLLLADNMLGLRL